MKVIIDIETEALDEPAKIWLICLRDVDTDKLYIYRNVTEDATEKERFLNDARSVTLWIGHNSCGFDLPHLERLLGLHVPIGDCVDTLVISKLLDYSRQGHSIEDYGLEFGIPKGKFIDFKAGWSQEMEDYCLRDVEITLKVYQKYLRFIQSSEWKKSIKLEHQFQQVVNSLHKNGFSFNTDKANKLLLKVTKELSVLDKDILKEFPPKTKLIREVTPKATKFGTISLTSIPKLLRDQISDMEIDAPFSYFEWVEFNPSSHKQIVDVLSNSGWSPADKTQTHIETERELNKLKYGRRDKTEVDIAAQTAIVEKLATLKRTGWRVNENNLNTLPPSAPKPARTLAQRILLESRRRTLTEWTDLVQPDGRIHGEFNGLGAWTHRMNHHRPNTANIPTDVKLYGGEMRSLWQAPKNRLLVGVDAEGIQLRIFAHYIDDKDFTKSLVEGKKDDKTDPHSLNQRVLGAKSRNIAKRFIFAFLLGAGIGKLAQILECSEDEARHSLDSLLARYGGLAFLKENTIPADAKRGYFKGLDGRLVKIPGETPGERKHLCMSGYLQGGEAVVMKSATVMFLDKLKDYDATLVNLVHDEWQTECPNDMKIALEIAKLQADCLRQVGEDLELKCPLAGSFYNDDAKDYTIGTNWKVTH